MINEYNESKEQDRHERVINNTHSLCQWIVANNKTPRKTSLDLTERKLNVFLRNMKSAKKGTGKSIWLPICQMIADEYNMYTLFDTIRADIYTQRVIDICKYVIQYNKIPSRYSTNDVERMLGTSLCRFKGYALSKTKYQHIIDKFNLPNLFNPMSVLDEAINDVHTICKFITQNNRMPKISVKSEKYYCKRIGSFKNGKLGAYGYFWSDELQEIANSYNLPNLFITKTPEEYGIDRVIQLCEFVKLHNRLPLLKTEPQLYNQLSNMIKGKKYIHGNQRWHESYQQIACDYGYPLLFERNINPTPQ